MSDAQLFPVLPLRDIIVFPFMVVPLFVGREKSIKALEDVMAQDKRILLLTQKDAESDEPTREDIYHRGCVAKILQLLKLPDGTVRVLVEGQDRAVVEAFTDKKEFIEAYAQTTPSKFSGAALIKKLTKQVRDTFETYGKLNKKIAEEVVTSVTETTEPSKLTDVISVHLTAKIDEKQTLLAEEEVSVRLKTILDLIDGETSVLKVEKKIRGRVKRCLLYTSPSPRDKRQSRMPSSA